MKNKISLILLIGIAIFFSVIYAEDFKPEVVGPNESTSRIRITPTEIQPVVLRRVPPNYPKAAREMGIQGEVVLEVEILDDGTIGEIEVFESVQEGPGGLDEAAIEAVKQWKYQPGTSRGEPVTMWIKQTINFTLH